MEELEQAEQRRWEDEHGSMTLIRVAPRLGIIKPEGRVGEEAATYWRDNFDWILTDETLLFFDAGNLSFPGARFTAIGSSITVDARPKMAEFHVLVSGAMIEMIAKAINVSLGGFMSLYRKRDEYEAELRRCLALQAG